MDYDKLAPNESVENVIQALAKRGIKAGSVDTKEEAFKRLKELIPAGAEIMTGSSTTLDQIGFTDLLKSGKHEWRNLKDAILAEKDGKKQMELRKRSVTSQFFISSVHAVTKDGEVLVASASGSQIPSCAYSSDNVVWIVGTQKIVPTLDEAFRRVREYVLPLEDKRMKGAGYPGSTIGKMLILEREIMPNRKITIIFVNEKLGF